MRSPGLAPAIGSLVPGYYRDGRLVHAGRVGTGFSHKLAEDLFRRLDTTPSRQARLRESSRPRMPGASASSARSWSPKWEFRTWTTEGLIRHASFHGLREDQLATEVALEKPHR